MKRIRTLRLREDDGRLSLFFAVLAIAIIASMGLAVDGGAKMRAVQLADNYATEAARAGAEAIVLPTAVTGGPKIIDSGRAIDAANRYLRDAGVTGTPSIDPGGRSITVTVTLSQPTIALNVIGIKNWSVTGVGHATLLTG